ncbi:MAG: rod shape-determining protein MreC [Gemmatimonadota bacterium]
MARTSRTGTRTDLALLGVALVLAFVALILPSGVRGSVQGTLRSSIAAPLVAAQAWAERGRQAIGDHGRLVKSVDSLALGNQSAGPLRSENDRLRALLGLGQRLQWGFVATEVIHAPGGSDEHKVLLAAGSAAGVRPFSPLVVPEGLIGMVEKVDASSSTAILWTHPDFRASATTEDGLAFGIVAAHLGTGADRFLLEMRGVPFRSDLKPGTLIVSSGLGNVFPRGIPIGVVLRETKTVEGWARTYLIRPIVSPDATTAAMVLLPPRAAAGVTGAWSSASSAEGTQQAIVVAGDSIIADSVRVIQERLAKLALLDSLRRAAIYGGDSGVRVETDSAAPSARSLTAVPPRTAPTTSTTPPLATQPSATVPRPVTPVTQPAVTTPRPVTTAPRPATPTASSGAPTSGAAPAPRVVRPPVSGAATQQSTARRDSLARAAARARAAESVRARTAADSAEARNRSKPKPPDNPFRLPPAGGRA